MAFGIRRMIDTSTTATYAADAQTIKAPATPAKRQPATTVLTGNLPASGPHVCPTSKSGGKCFNYQPKNGTCIWSKAKFPGNVKLAWKINQGPAGFGPKYWNSWCKLGMAESGWRHKALGPYVKRKDHGKPLGRACSLAQALPCIKHDTQYPILDTHGRRLDSFNPEGQIMWMANYIRIFYGNPDKAWHYEITHQWY
jgi:hypothetical protein